MLNVYVGKRHIEHGKRANCDSCPIALALMEKNIWSSVSVSTTTAYFPNSCGYLPPAAKKFISNFDSGHPVKPFSFRIKVKP